jgi:hypothetical protein
MTKYTYIQKDTEEIYVEFDFELDSENNRTGRTLNDYISGAWVLLSKEQLAFREANPGASVEEVFNMEITVVEPEPEPARTLEDAVRERQISLYRYDTSEAVNSFLIGGVPCWIDAQQRAVYNASIRAAELLGEDTIEIPLAGQFFTLPVAQADRMLASIQRYADKAAIVTAKHKVAIEALATIEEVEAYDFTAGYPEKVMISLPS